MKHGLFQYTLQKNFPFNGLCPLGPRSPSHQVVTGLVVTGHQVVTKWLQSGYQVLVKAMLLM